MGLGRDSMLCWLGGLTTVRQQLFGSETGAQSNVLCGGSPGGGSCCAPVSPLLCDASLCEVEGYTSWRS